MRMTDAAKPALPMPADAETRGRGRPRAASMDETILRVARDVLANEGYEALSFKGIEQQTGITRASIYRRWKTKAHLASDVAHGVGRHMGDGVTGGGLAEQIRALVAEVYRQYRRPEVGAASAGLIAAYQRDPQLRAELHDPAERTARADLAAIVRRAGAAGEIRPDVDADALFDMIVGTVIYRTIFSSVDPGEDFVDHVSTVILGGIRPVTSTGI
jgi:AcrR family transcriptional regulator